MHILVNLELTILGFPIVWKETTGTKKYFGKSYNLEKDYNNNSRIPLMLFYPLTK